jgi:hypothetical protein
MNRLAQSLGGLITDQAAIRYATVTGIEPGAVTVELSGGTITVAHLSSYTPTVGDTVAIWVQGSQLLVLGALA